MGVASASVCFNPVITDLLGILQYARMLKDSARLRPIFEESGAVFIYCNHRSQRVLHHGNGGKANKAIKAQPWDMQDLFTLEIDVFAVLTRFLIRVGVIDVIEVSIFHPVHFHVFRQERI